MSSPATDITCNWLRTGDEIFPAMLAAIEEAKTEVCLETYTFRRGRRASVFATR